jgi:hypothetical protein
LAKPILRNRCIFPTKGMLRVKVSSSVQQNWTTISKFCFSAAKKDIISSQNSLLNFAETTIFYRVLRNQRWYGMGVKIHIKQ